MKPYPLQFIPEMKERIWGGRNLERYGMTLPDGVIGEGWMIGDHPNGTTKVKNGALAGFGLDQIRHEYGEAFLGTKGFSTRTGRFPLLIKLLDCQDDLSIQVHPSDHYANLPEGELGKTEMWYIVDAKPGAKIIYGIKPGVSREDMDTAIREERVMDTLQEFSVAAGDSFYIPAGTVHALCAGVLVAEIQQNSDTTYRLFDYNRPGLDGKLRELHVADSLNVISYSGSEATRMTTDMSDAETDWLTLARSPYFVVEKGVIDGERALSTTPDSFIVHIICDGTGFIEWAEGILSVQAGDCFLIPASLGDYKLKGNLTVLRSYLP